MQSRHEQGPPLLPWQEFAFFFSWRNVDCVWNDCNRLPKTERSKLGRLILGSRMKDRNALQSLALVSMPRDSFLPEALFKRPSNEHAAATDDERYACLSRDCRRDPITRPPNAIVV
jgi:hypothetical protein